MDQIKFGEGSVSISSVIEILKSNDASYKRLCDALGVFGYKLGLTEDEMTIIFEKLTKQSETTDRHDIPREMLRLWKRGHEGEANLKVLFYALDGVGLADLAALVSDKLGTRPGAGPDAAEPAAKRSRLNTQDNSAEEEDDVNVNVKVEGIDSDGVSKDDGIPPLIQAIIEGQDVGLIRRVLENEVDLNAASTDSRYQNVWHLVIKSLMRKVCLRNAAVAILNLLIEKGFNFINVGDCNGHTPLHYLMAYEDLDEQLLTWFFEHGANFNAVTNNTKSSVLMVAIMRRQGVGILRNILDFGGDSNHVTRLKRNALHIAAAHAHDSAMELFMDTLGVNEVDEINETPLHYLYSYDHLDYQHCLKLLLRKGANFAAEDKQGNVPLVKWMKYGKGNPFPMLVRLKDRLPITDKMASKSLTVIVKEMERFKKFLPSPFLDSPNEFVQFIMLLIQGNKGKLRWKDDCQGLWKQQNWGILKPVILTRKFVKELRTTGGCNWIVRFTAVGSNIPGTLDFLTESDGCTIPLETVLVCLLGCKNYKAFLEVCRCVQMFCAEI